MESAFQQRMPRPVREAIAHVAVVIVRDVERRAWFLPHHNRGWGNAFAQVESAIRAMVLALK